MFTALNLDYCRYDPCKALLASIIERAILDLRQPFKPIRDSAKCWLFSDCKTEFSLLWCLHWLDMEGSEDELRIKACSIIKAANKDLLAVRYMHGSVLDLKGVRQCVS